MAAQTSQEFEREVRFAVVIYGGVSLAIYINGVVQEMLRLVRSTAIADETQLTHSEKVYRKLACMLGLGTLGIGHTRTPSGEDVDDFWDLYFTQDDRGRYVPLDNNPRTRFIVDILSGTSAGGINAIYLAKALANAQPLDQLARMWINVADIDRLLNDKGSNDGPVKAQDPPRSLLNSRWMYLQLLSALDGMDSAGAGHPMVDELDLFTTTTDLDGVRVSIPLADRSVDEKRYKNVFHFRMQAEQESAAEKGLREQTSDFGGYNNPFLAFAARCTSAFPFAFEPMALSDVAEVIRSVPPHMNRDYCDEDARFWQRFYLDYVPDRPGRTPFKWRAFGDGGYLDNKPFTYAIETIMKRRADLPVDRKLIYIEPSPENPGEMDGPARQGADDRPDAAQNSLKALVELPRYETIRQDLEQLLAWNNDVSRIKRVVAHIEALSQEGRQSLDRTSLAFQSYFRLRLSAVTDAVSDQVAKALRLDLKSGDAAAIRALAGVWRDIAITTEDEKQRFLDNYDIEYCRRAIRHARKRVRREHLSRHSAGTAPAERIPADVKELYRQISQADRILAEAANFDVTAILNPSAVPATMHEDLRLIVDPGQVWAALAEPPELMMTATEAGKGARAEWVLNTHGWKQTIDALHEALSGIYGNLLNQVREIIDPILTRRMGPDGFLLHDSLLFPVTFATELGEIGPVDVTRISPQDASPIDGIDRDGKRGPLKGDQFGAFGGFLDKSWRLHDMLRGRLDGAERLISAILPATDSRTSSVRKALIAEAQEAIARDWEETLPTLIPQANAAAAAAGTSAARNESGPGGGQFLTRAERFLANVVRGR